MKTTKIQKALLKINEICEKLQSQRIRLTSLNVLNDYKIILNDDRIYNNQKGKDIINTIISELKEYDNEDVRDYYELETYLPVMKEYRKLFNLD